uniref:Rho GTPase-activating protein 1 n=1 Tax=Hydra vulgaris TaxID=6087 RepID=T2MEH5_HYDVU
MKKLTISAQDLQNLNSGSGLVMADDFCVLGDQENKNATRRVEHDLVKDFLNDPEVKQPDEFKTNTVVKLKVNVMESSGLSIEQLQDKYADIAKLKIFHVAGDDLTGRPVIAFSACRLPNRKDIDHQQLLCFLKEVLDCYVENDYTLVYFHYGLRSINKPSFKWLLQVYKELDRKYKKNLKAFYIVHPSNFIKAAFNIFYPFISKKFGKKINNISKLDELTPHLRIDQIDIPEEVKQHDKIVVEKFKSVATSQAKEIPKTQQFSISLTELKRKHPDRHVPIVVSSCIEFIEENALDIEGIFRRSAQVNLVNEAVDAFNMGIQSFLQINNVHLATALLKKFLRDLPEPLLTFKLYGSVMEFSSLPEEDKLKCTKRMLNEFLPSLNHDLLVYLLRFLEKVVEHSSANRMVSSSLAIVFGPNLLWSDTESASLTSMSKINSYCKYLIDNSHLIFDESVS